MHLRIGLTVLVVNVAYVEKRRSSDQLGRAFKQSGVYSRYGERLGTRSFSGRIGWDQLSCPHLLHRTR